jgi:hypothetical protein
MVRPNLILRGTLPPLTKKRPREETKKAMKAKAKEAGKKRKRTDDGGKQVIGTEKKNKE